MKKCNKLILTWAALLWAALAASAQDTLKVLCIGNSFSEDAVEQYLSEIANEYGVPMRIGNLYIGGCSLERHANNVRENRRDYRYRVITTNEPMIERQRVSILEALDEDDWDVVTMQQASHFSGQWQTYEPFLSELYDSVRLHISADCRIMWHMTWAYSKDSQHSGFANYGNSQQKMHAAIQDCLKKLMKSERFDGLIPGGYAIRYARQSKLGDTLCRDGFHMQIPYGRYCLACTWFEALTGYSPKGIEYMPEGMTAEQRLLTQRAAHRANLHVRALKRNKVGKKTTTNITSPN